MPHECYLADMMGTEGWGKGSRDEGGGAEEKGEAPLSFLQPSVVLYLWQLCLVLDFSAAASPLPWCVPAETQTAKDSSRQD